MSNEPMFDIEMAEAMLANIEDESDWTAERARDLFVELRLACGRVRRDAQALHDINDRYQVLKSEHKHLQASLA